MYFLWVWWVLIEEFVFLIEEVVCLWMEGGHCRGIEEEALGEKGLSGFMGLRKERWGRKVYRVLEKLYFSLLQKYTTTHETISRESILNRNAF